MQIMSRKDDCLNHMPMEIFFVFFEKGCCTVSCSKSVIKTRLLSLNISTSSIIGIDTNLGSGTKHRNRRTTM